MTDKPISPLRQRMIEDIACPGPEPGAAPGLPSHPPLRAAGVRAVKLKGDCIEPR